MNSVGNGKTLHTANSVRKQMQFLILLTLIDDEDYELTGINVDNLLAYLPDNKLKWLKVGAVRDDKKWSVRLSGELSYLDREESALRRFASGKYSKGKKFDEKLQSLVEELYDHLEVEIELGEYAFNPDFSRMDIMQKVVDGEIVYGILSVDHDTKKNLFTDEQISRLVQLCVLYGCHE